MRIGSVEKFEKMLPEPRGFSTVDIDEPRVAGVTRTVPEHSVIRDAVMLACRAPSVHNSQPWLWGAEGMALHLFANPKRLLRITDRTGRDMLLSCGAVLDHLNVAMAALGWRTAVDRFPEADGHDHLATVHFSPAPSVDDSQARRADAMLKRRTDRLPFAAPAGWNALVSAFRNEVSNHDVTLAVVADDDREQLAQASQLTEALRRQDLTYQSELRWWTSPFNLDEGVPARSRLSTSEAGRVDVARAFPPFGHGDRRRRVDIDHSKIVVLCTRDDSRSSVLRCGEALSAVLLECAIAGLATCTLTHMIEVTPSRDIVRRLVGETGLPQLLIRVGRAPAGEQQPPATPRLPVQDVLEFRS